MIRVFPHHALRARGRRRTPGQMNAVEEKYNAFLAEQHRLGVIAWYAFEPVTFKLAADTRYTPDFLVMMPDGSLECREVKGGKKNKRTGARTFWCEEDAKLKVKVAARMYTLIAFAIVYPLEKGIGWGRKDFEP